MDRTEVERKLQVVTDRLAAIGAEQAELEAKRRELIVRVADGDAEAEAAIVALDRQNHELQQGRTLQEQARAVLNERMAEIEKQEAAAAEAARVERIHQEALAQVECGTRLQALWDAFTDELQAYEEHRTRLVDLAYGSTRPLTAPMPATLNDVVESTSEHTKRILRGDYRRHQIATALADTVWGHVRPFFRPGFDASAVRPDATTTA